MIDRRSLLIAGASAGIASTLAPPATAATAPVGKQAPGIYRYKVGEFELTAITDGVARRKLEEGFVRNASLADVQAALEAAFLPKDTLNIPYTPLVVNTGRNLVLIDTGFADNGLPTTGGTLANMGAAGIDPKDIDTVIISHFHGDHIQGARLKSGAASYPNAEIMVPAPEWAFWMDDARMAQAPEAMKPSFNIVRRVFGPVAKDVRPYEWGKEIVPGITTVAAPGHTPGHTAYVIQSGNSRLLVLSDTTNHPALFVRNPDWSAVFDMNADQARETRHKLLDMAATERLQVAGFHFPFPATGHIAKDGNRYQLVPVAWSPVL